MEVNDYRDEELDTSGRQKKISIDNSIDDSLKAIDHQLTINGIENNK